MPLKLRLYGALQLDYYFFAYFSSLREAASSAAAAAPAFWTALSDIGISQWTFHCDVPSSQHNDLLLCHGMRVRPSGRTSVRNNPTGSLVKVTGTPDEEKLRATKSFRACLADRPVYMYYYYYYYYFINVIYLDFQSKRRNSGDF